MKGFFGPGFAVVARPGWPCTCANLHGLEGRATKASSGTAVPGPRNDEGGFTLLEVLVALAILAIGAALTLSLISRSLGNIRKVQERTRTIQHAETVLEMALLDGSINKPTNLTGDFEDGTRWAVRVEDFELPEDQTLAPALESQLPGAQMQRAALQVKLLCYTAEVMGPGSGAPDYRVQTLKLVSTKEPGRPTGNPQ